MHQEQPFCIICVLHVAKCFGQVSTAHNLALLPIWCLRMGSAIQTVSAAAVNTYFRAVLAEQVNRADFEPREYAQLANYQAPTAPKCTQHPLTTEQTNLENIPSSVLEHVLQHTNLYTVCSAALASRSLCKVKLVTSFETHDVELAGCMCHIQGVYAAAHLVSSPDGMLQ